VLDDWGGYRGGGARAQPFISPRSIGVHLFNFDKVKMTLRSLLSRSHIYKMGLR
jgi:hypothetical protein